MNHGYLRVAAAVPKVNVADVDYNIASIEAITAEISAVGASVIVFPELCVTAYTCGDLFHNSTLIEAALKGIERLTDFSATTKSAIIVGAPLLVGGQLYNCAVAISGGKIAAIVPKTYLPDYNEFYEKRWFVSAPDTDVSFITVNGQNNIPFGSRQLLDIDGVKCAIEICEDLWTVIPPSSRASLAGAEVIFNLSASDDIIGKYAYLQSLIEQQSARCMAAYVYSSAGYGESSTDLVFDGKAIIAENGALIACNRRWSHEPSHAVADIDIEALRRDRMHMRSFGDCARKEHLQAYHVSDMESAMQRTDDKLMRTINPRPFVPASGEIVDRRCEEIVNIQIAGLARRLEATRTTKLVIGISGGLDSTLALLVAVMTFDRLGLDRKGITGITMPGFGTTDRTYTNAMELMKALGITIREIPIAASVKQHFNDIGHDINNHDVTYENSQARERTQILMDVANQTGGMVLGTGDLSELALGWATYNGDHMSMYGVNASIPKTLVRYLVRWFATHAFSDKEKSTLEDIIDTPISPELIPADSDGNIKQKTEDLVGPYELHDFFLYYILRYGFSPKRIFFMARHAFSGIYDDDVIRHWLKTFIRRFFNQQFKRSCLPDGPKVGSVCLSPRGDWRMPSDASSALWLAECDTL
ncbi:MAG: NAD(+) synthase [Muribaculum sp.]